MASLVCMGLAVVATSATASAPVVELAHEIEIELHDTYATLKVQRTLASDHVDGVEVRLSIDATHPMAATALATRADDGRWYQAELMDVHEAVDTYWRLTGSRKIVPEGELPPRMPSLTPKDPALMMWQPHALDVFVYPVAEGRPKAIAYTLQVPYEHYEGAQHVHVPTVGDVAPTITFAGVPRGVQVSADAAAIEKGTVLVGSATEDLVVRLDAVRSPALAVSLAATRADARHMARVEVVAGRELGPDPVGTHAIVVLDRSRSLGEDSFAAAQRAVQAYLDELSRVPGAKVQIVGFDRHVHALHTGFVSPRTAGVDLRDVGWDQRNGSDLGAALQRAAERLRAAPREAPRRVLIVSDAAVTEAVAKVVTSQLRTLDAVVHLADIEGARATDLARDLTHPWGDHVTATGGEVWRGTVDAVDGQTHDVFAQWVRPQRIEDVVVDLDGHEVGESVLDVGEGTIDVNMYEHTPRMVTVRGRLWGTTVLARARRSARADRELAITAAAYLGEGMTDAEITAIARRAGAVSPMTALLALEPDASPGQAVDPDPSRPSRTFSTSCRFGGGEIGDFGRYSLAFDEAELVRTEVVAAIDACGAAGEDVSVELTTTYAEITEVDRVEIEGAPELESCVRDELWSIEYPPGRHGSTRHLVEHEGR